MKIHDISMPIFYEMPVYKGKESKRPLLSVDSDFKTGTSYESRLEMNLHTGTHIDGSLHMVENGWTIDALALEKVVCRCKVLDFTSLAENITRGDLEKKNIQKGDFILLKTKNSYEDILEKEFVYLEKTGAEYLKEQKIGGVGIDALGIERAQPEHETHTLLFGADIVILEGLRLKEIQEGEYFLVAVPLNIPKAEAAPVRAILVEGF